MKRHTIFILIPVIMCLSACNITPETSTSEFSSSSESSESKENSKESSSSGSEEIIETSQLYKDLFTPEKKIEIIAEFSNESIYKLGQYGPNSSPYALKEMYHPANVVIKIDNEVVFDDIYVGFRMRGITMRIE